MATIEQRFRELHPTSANLAEEARSVFPEGVTHESRRMDPFPVFMDRGKGTHKWDVDGNEYIDFRTGHGSMILGQAHPSVAAAVHRQMDKGTHLGASTELELRWALLVKQLAPSVEKIRFHSSGTEADMMALKMARVFTGKTKIVKFRDGFHGWSDAAAVRDPDRDRQFGIPPETAASVIVLPDGDLDAVERTLGERDDVAAVILQGDEIIRPEFIRGLRDTTAQHGVLLIVDEVVSGFRWSKAGLHGRFGFTPDLSTYAKILAGGLPGACVGGRSEIIDTIGKNGIGHPGTFNANPLSAAAGVAALEIVEREPITETADARAVQLKAGINDVLQRMEIPGGAYGVSSIVHLSLGQEVDTTDEFATPVDSPGSSAGVRSDAVPQLQLALVNEGLWTTPLKFFLSAVHTPDEIDITVARYEAALIEVRKTGAI